MICKNCGNYHEDNLMQCPYCGVAVQYEQPDYAQQPNNAQQPNYAQQPNVQQPVYTQPPVDEDKPSTVINVVSLLLLPLLGIIIYFVEKDKHPIKAKAALKFGIGGYVLSLVVGIFSAIFGMVLGFLPMLLEEFL